MIDRISIKTHLKKRIKHTLEHSLAFVAKKREGLDHPWIWRLQGTSPSSRLQPFISSNQHHGEKLLSRLISQNGAPVMGSKWTTTVNCSRLLRAFMTHSVSAGETSCSAAARDYVSARLPFRGNVSNITHVNISSKRHRMGNVKSYCWIFHHFGTPPASPSCQVAYCKHHASFPPTAGLRGHEKCWLNPFLRPHTESQGRE